MFPTSNLDIFRTVLLVPISPHRVVCTCYRISPPGTYNEVSIRRAYCSNILYLVSRGPLSGFVLASENNEIASLSAHRM